MSERVEFFMGEQERLAEPYHYLASGLDNVFLANGVSIEETPYGAMVTIENLNGLHHAIGLHIVEKAAPLTGAEFRFLRKQMNRTQRDMAAVMKISDQTIANYEKGKSELGPADPLMRLTYLLDIVPDETRAKVVKDLAEAMPRKRVHRLPDGARWKLVQDWQELSRQAA